MARRLLVRVATVVHAGSLGFTALSDFDALTILDTDPSTSDLWRANVVLDFARSELFDRTFCEGMELVEETASYLDGHGRQESKLLNRNAALGYASESMRLTTRLMQVASWLLVQRAVREGSMAPQAACEARYRLAREPIASKPDKVAMSVLPVGLIDLLDRSERLYERVMHLDRRMYVDVDAAEPPHPVLSQMQLLKAAFGG